MASFRHIVFVLNHEANSVSFYLDGGLLVEKFFATPGYVAALDCFDSKIGAEYRGLGENSQKCPYWLLKECSRALTYV